MMIAHLVTSSAVLAVILLAARLLPLTARTRHGLLLIGVAKFAIPDSAIVAALRLAGLDLERVGREVVPPYLRVFGGGAAVAAPAAEPQVNWLAVASLTVALLMISRWTLLRIRTVRAVANGATPASPREQTLLHEAMSSIGLTRTIALVRSTILEAPAVVRVIRPVIALPSHGLDELSDDEARAVLLHECAHVKRHDNLIAIFEALAAALLWFHPLVHYALRQLAAAREEACDEVAADGARPETYLAALTKICRAAIAPRTAGAACMASPHIKRRVEHLMNYERLKRTAFPHKAVLLATVVAALLITPLTTTFATETKRVVVAKERFTLSVDAKRQPKPATPGLRSEHFHLEMSLLDNTTSEVLMTRRVVVPATVAASIFSKEGAFDVKISAVVAASGSGTATVEVTEGTRIVQKTTHKIQADGSPSPNAGEPITLKLKDAKLTNVLEVFGRMTGRTVTIAPGIEGTVTIDVAGLPWEEALEIIARHNHLEITVTAENILVNEKK